MGVEVTEVTDVTDVTPTSPTWTEVASVTRDLLPK